VTHTRILALHGYHGSADILRRQIAPLAAALPTQVELVLVDAPSLAAGDYGWWHGGFRGWERTRDWVVELVAREHVDGVFGFSQGAALAGLLAAVQDSQMSSPLGFEFAIMVGGFTSVEPRHAALFGRKLSLPSVHVAGTSDGIVPIRDSLALAERFADPVVLEHGGGHVIPSDRELTARIAQFITEHATARTGARRA
jgi:pimeloyl-ACP methyl ester carboxylesterase